MSQKRYQVFCSAKLQWNGRKLEPFKRSRSQGIAEAECMRLAKENPGAVAVALGPEGYKFTVEPAAQPAHILRTTPCGAVAHVVCKGAL